MKKKYEKGFFLSETMVVLAVVAIILIAVFKIFSTTYIKYQESENYNTINSVNALASIKKYFESFGEIDAESLLGDNAYVNLTTNANYANEYYNSIKDEYDIDSIYLINMSTIKSNLSNFNVLLKKYIESLPDNNNIMLLINVKGNQFTSINITKELPSLIGNENDEYAVYINPGEEFIDPGYINWEGESPITAWESPFDINTNGIYYLKYNFDNYILRRKVQVIEKEYEFNYTGSFQEFTIPATGWYEVELWGAQGGDYSTTAGGKGAYTSGKIYLEKNEKINIYVGEKGNTNLDPGYNGGGKGGTTTDGSYSSGGGATDVRYLNTGLKDRIMVAAGGAGSGMYASIAMKGGSGGRLIGNSGAQVGSGAAHTLATGGTQTSGGLGINSSTSITFVGQFGLGGNNTSTNISYGSGGGGGYYGGASGYATSSKVSTGAGGSSFISGYAGVNAIDSTGTHTNNTLHYSGKYFIEGKMESGVNSGNGKAKITFIDNQKLERINSALNNVRYIKDCTNGNSKNTDNHWTEIQAIYNGTNIAKGKIGKLYNASNVEITSAHDANCGFNKATDGDFFNITGSSGYFAGSTYSGNQCFIIDLGKKDNEELYDLDEIAIWHYWLDGRTYNSNIVSVSPDGINYSTVKYVQSAETNNGNRVLSNEIYFSYTGDVQEFNVPATGTYQIELWGAQGGSNSKAGAGAYTKGKINLNKNEKIYIYVGGKGNYTAAGVAEEISGGYNGGGSTGGQTCCSRNFGSGGGATDIRYFNNYTPTLNDLEWDSEIGLRSRIMVAAGGGGSFGGSGSLSGGGYGGALVGGNGTTANGYGPGGGATQIAGGARGACTAESCVGDAGDFGYGGTLLYNDLPTMATGGGGGYYGGGSSGHIDAAGGGSSYISGYTGCVAVTAAGNIKDGCSNGTTDNSCSIHYSGKKFTDSTMIAGNASMSTYEGGTTMVGNSGDGYAKITLIR